MAKEFGWAYVVGSQASGPKGSIQIAGPADGLDHDPNLLWDDAANALMIDGNIIAHNFEIQNQTKTVYHFTTTGSSVFGDTTDDFHQFTGSLGITGDITATNHYGWGGDLDGVPVNYYNNHCEYRLITSADSRTIQGEDAWTFNGTLLNVLGDINAIEIDASQFSGTIGIFDELESDVVIATELTASAISSSTAVIPNSTFGDIVLTGRIIDANGNVILGTPTAQSEVNISNTNPQTTITSANFNSVNAANAVGMDYAVISDGIELATNAFVAKVGGVGVGTNVPAKKMEVFDETGAQLRLSSLGASQLSNGGGWLFNPLKHHTDLETNTEGMFSISPTGQRVGINNVSPEHALDVSGDARITGNLIVSGTLTARVTDFAVSADTLTFGDEASDTVVMNANTMTAPNGLVIDNDLYMSGGMIGIGDFSGGGKFEVEAPSNQFKVGTSTEKLSVNVHNGSTSISTDTPTIDIANPTNILGELVVGSNGDITLDNGGKISSSVSVTSHSGYFTNIESNTITNGNTTINAESINTPTLDVTTVNTTVVNSSTIGGTLTTAAQPNITSLGTITSINVANAANIGGPVAINRHAASRMMEIKDINDAQLRLTSTEDIFGISEYQYVDLRANTAGDLEIAPKSGKAIVPQLKLTNVPQGSSFNHLSLDQDGNVVLSPNLQHGIEVRNRTVIHANYDVVTNDYFIAIQAQTDTTITLPNASEMISGQILVLTDETAKAQEFVIKVKARDGQTIDGRNEITMVSPRSSVSVYTDGQANFFIF